MIAVDTHVVIWDALSPERLSVAATEALASAHRTDGLLVADITLWEIAMLIQKERIQVNTDCYSFLNLILQANLVRIQPITPQIAMISTQLLPTVNADPADRLIVATALEAGVALITADRNLRGSDEITTVW